MIVSKGAKSGAFWRLSSKVANYKAKSQSNWTVIYKPTNKKSNEINSLHRFNGLSPFMFLIISAND
jgi:hypothetical protein